MNAFRLAMLLSLIAGPSMASAQTVLYWHPSSGANQAIDDMVDDIESGGATVTSTSDVEEFYKHTANGPWDLVLAADLTVDTEEEHVAGFLAGGGSIFVLTTDTNGDLIIDLLSIARAMQQVVIDPVHTGACFAQYAACMWRYNDGCAWTTPPITQDRVDCDNACFDELIDCLLV